MATPESSLSARLLAALPSSLLLLNRDLQITYLNDAAQALFRVSKTQSPLPLKELLKDAGRLPALASVVLKTGARAMETDFPLHLRHEERAHYVTLQLAPVYADTQLHEVSDVLMLIDPPPQFARNQPFAMMEHASTMAAILNHEIKNPLAAIRAAAQHLGPKQGAAGQQMTSLICDEVERIRQMIDELEIFSNPQQIKTEPINIHQVLRTALSVNSNYLGHITIREEYDPSLPPAQGNERLLLQALRNIIKNAAEALTENSAGHELRLITSFQTGHYRQGPEGERLSFPITVDIMDNGPGVPTDIRSRLFEPFVSRKASGKGLGLSIVSKIIADHKGSIEYLPVEPYGSCFRIRLPIAKD
jgi:two-component system, NtrC family, nitrogen regulation sensor histidine kinase GlnL